MSGLMIRYTVWVLISSDSEIGSVTLQTVVLKSPHGSDGSEWVPQIVFRV